MFTKSRVRKSSDTMDIFSNFGCLSVLDCLGDAIWGDFSMFSYDLSVLKNMFSIIWS